MSEELLTILKLCLMALLYLFFFRVLRAVWMEINPPKEIERVPVAAPAPAAQAPAPGMPMPGVPAPAPNLSKRQAKRVPAQLTMVEPAAYRGRVIPLAAEMTIGRAGGCNIPIPDDTFASQIHARVFNRDGQTWVEDLGSTNGTFVNRARIATPTAVHRGDQVQVGNTILELG